MKSFFVRFVNSIWFAIMATIMMVAGLFLISSAQASEMSEEYRQGCGQAAVQSAFQIEYWRNSGVEMDTIIEKEMNAHWPEGFDKETVRALIVAIYQKDDMDAEFNALVNECVRYLEAQELK